MKKFSNRKMEFVLLIERVDIDNYIASMFRGEHVNYLIAPIELKDNEQFLKQAECNISIEGKYWEQILYYI